MKQIMTIRANISYIKDGKGEYMPIKEIVLITKDNKYNLSKDGTVYLDAVIDEYRFFATKSQLSGIIQSLTELNETDETEAEQ